MGTDIEMALRVLLAAVLGFGVGLQRARHGSIAGTRTFGLVTLGSALYTVLSVSMAGVGIPDRIAANIVTGVGFLGGGVIFKEGATVRGLTTAAGIWAMAAVGMACGLGYYALSAATALLVMTLFALGHVGWLEGRRRKDSGDTHDERPAG